ncbi:hypothetical protein GGS23DRAFT_595112 [Durotheca rogersii]|uniref:uncharacterized protein n=1 Tax=Durotheca rogersii TaxID=419775 RepID=UPI002220A81A|nr:uncharacterized protein GGS23DRAFT_595112 [Durotheca rogersii]KAI5865595.1 hypothetical protein GGS23DRAFT_595112 [Durotheca rogersii]
MCGFDKGKINRDNLYGEARQAKITHEVLGCAAAFEAMKVFEERYRKEGQVMKHTLAKEVLADIAGAEVDKLVETKSLEYLDREKARQRAQEQAVYLYDAQYSDLFQYDP